MSTLLSLPKPNRDKRLGTSSRLNPYLRHFEPALQPQRGSLEEVVGERCDDEGEGESRRLGARSDAPEALRRKVGRNMPEVERVGDLAQPDEPRPLEERPERGEEEGEDQEAQTELQD